MARARTNLKSSLATVVVLLSSKLGFADSFDTSSRYFPGSFIQSISVDRHLFDESESFGNLIERKRAEVNEYEFDPVRRPTKVGWTMGYSFGTLDKPSGITTGSSDETQHSMHIGLFWELLEKFDLSALARFDTVPIERYRGGAFEFEFGVFEFLRKRQKKAGFFEKSEDEEDEESNLSPMVLLARRQQERDEEERRRKLEAEGKQVEQRGFTERSLYLRLFAAWNKQQLSDGALGELEGVTLGPKLYFLPRADRTYRFSLLFTNFYSEKTPSDFSKTLGRPGPRAALANTRTGYADLSALMRGFPTWTFSGGGTWDVPGPWLYDASGALYVYSYRPVVAGLAGTAWRSLSTHLTTGLGLDLVVSNYWMVLATLKFTYVL